MKRAILAAAAAALSFVGFADNEGLTPVALPADYLLLNGAYSDGHGQYVDTEYVFKTKPAVVCGMKVMATKVTMNQDPLGTPSSSLAGCFGINFDSSLYYRYGKTSSNMAGFPADVQSALLADYTPCAFSNEVWMADKKILGPVTGDNFPANTQTFYIFSGSGRPLASGFSYVKMYDDGVLVRDYLPCKDPSGTVGLWDSVEGTFKSSAANGSLVADGEGVACTLVVEDNLGGQVAVAPVSGNYFGVSGAVEFVAPSSEQLECLGAEIYEFVGGAWSLVETKSGNTFTLTLDAAKRTKVSWLWKAALGMNEPKYVSSGYRTALVSAQVTGIGKTATSATLTFAYGTAEDALDESVAVTVSAAGEWRATLQHLAAGVTYYVKATLTNDAEDEPVVSEAIPFDQPECDEPGLATSSSYVQKDHLVAFWDGYDNVALGEGDRSAMTWTDISGHGFDWTLADGTYEWTDRGLWLKNVGRVGSIATKTGNDFKNKVKTVEFVYANKQSKHAIIFAPGFGSNAYLYTDANNRVGFHNAKIGTTVVLNSTNCFSVIYSGTGETPTGVSNFRVNGAPRSNEGMGENWSSGLTEPVLGDRTSGGLVASGELFAIRIYDVELTSEEREQNYKADVMRYLEGRNPSIALQLADGQLTATVPASAAVRTATFYWGENYGGTNEWVSSSEAVTIPAGATTVSCPKPTGWGSSVRYARVKVGEGDAARWSKTLEPEPPAPIGMNAQLSKASSEFGSSDIAATVIGIGETASEATLTFHYGTASNALDGTVEVTVTDAGEWRGTIPHCIAGQTYYVQATLSNDVAEVVASDVFDFVQPEFVEDRGFVDIRDMPEGYIQMKRLAVTGKEWVQTDFLPTQTTAAEFSFGDVVNAGTEATIFGQAWSSSEYLFGILYSTPQFCFFGNGSKLSLVADECDYFLTIEPTSGGNGSLTLLNKTDPTRDFSATVSLATDQTAKLKLFGLSATGNLATDRMVTMTFYSLKFWKDGELAADYVPAYEVSSDTAGLCDLKGGRFYPSQATAFAPQPFVLNAELKPVNGRFEVKVVKAGFDQIVTFCWGETYGGTGVWEHDSSVTIPAGSTTKAFDFPAGWGKTVWFARAKVGVGDDVYWSKTLMAEPPAPLGVEKPTCLSSAFGSSVVAATVTGIGKTASEATLVFEYGTASGVLDHTLPAQVIDNAGAYEVTIPHLIAGTHCYVKATLSNDVNEVVVSDVFDFVQPEVEEPGIVSPELYAQQDHLVAFWDGLDNVGVGRSDRSATTWTDLTGNGFDWTLNSDTSRYEWTDRGLWLKGVGLVGSLATKKVADFDNKITTIEFIYANMNPKDGIIFSPGFGASTSLYTDRNGHVGFYGVYYNDNAGTTAALREMNCYSVVYTRTGTRPTGVKKFWVNGTETTAEKMVDYWTVSVPALGDRSDKSQAANGELLAIRIYDVELTDAEREQNRKIDDLRYFQRVNGALPLEFANGALVLTVPASDAVRTAVLCWGETYGGAGTWTSASGEVEIPAGATTVSFPKPEGWGRSVWFARAKVGEGDSAHWSKTMMPEPPAALGMSETLVLASSAFGSSEVTAQVTGIGKTASEATLVFAYGTVSNALDGMVEMSVTDAGEWRGTIPRLRTGTTYYVQATLSNDVAEVVTSEVLEFVQPEVVEPGVFTSDSYVKKGLVAQWDGIDNAGRGVHDPAATAWADLTGHGHTLGNFVQGVTWTENAYATPTTAYSSSATITGTEVGFYDFRSYETVFAADQEVPSSGATIFATGGFKGLVLIKNASKRGFQIREGGRFFLCDYDTTGQLQQLYADYAGDDTPDEAFYGGEALGTTTYSESWGSGGFRLGFTNNKYPFYGRICTIRLYDRKLTAAEREQNRQADTVRFSLGLEGGVPIELSNGRFAVTFPASDAERTATFYWGETYGGVDAWASGSRVTASIPAGATTVSFPKPEGWGSSVWFVRVKIGDGSAALWSKTMMPEPPAPLGMRETLSLAASAFGSSEVAAQVTGIGTTASEATLTFDYGTTPDCSDGSVEVDVTDAGEWRGTIPHCIAGQTYYVKATLDNGRGERAESEVFKFVQLEVAEEGHDPRLRPLPEGYVQMEKLTSTGQEYVLIDYWKPDNKTSSEVELGEFAIISGEFSLFGQKYDTSQYLMTIQQNVFTWYGGGDKVSPDNPIPTDGTKYQIKIDALGTGNGDVTVSNRTTGVTAKQSNKTLAANGSNFAVFSDSANKHPASCSLYSFKAWKNGEISIDLVPAYKTATGEAGLIDLVTGEFRVSATATAFAKQPYAPGTELIRQGDKLVMELPVSDVGRTVSLYAGEAYGGTNGWGAAVETVQVAAGETTVEFDLPANWGTSVWFARAKVGDGAGARWTRTLVAADANLPSVSLDSLDGLGGDTMVVKGAVDSLGGPSCTLKVYTGTSEDAITEEWANLDGDVRVDTGDYTLTLRENDTTASRYLNPGETYFVRVVATSSNGKVAWSSVMSVKMAGAAAFSPASVTYAKRVMTVTTAMSDVGMTGETEVQLWVGADAGSLAMVMNAVVTKVGESFTLSYELPLYETPYVWQLKAVNTSEGETKTTTTPTSEANASAPDSATYTWTGAGADNRWANRDNWSDNKGGDSLGYPQTANATAVFNKNADVEIDLPRNGTTSNLSSLNLGTADIDVRFHSADTNACGLVLSGLTVPGKNARWTLDHAFVHRAGNYAWTSGSTVVLTNGACLYINNCQFDYANATVKVLDGSWLDIGEFRGGNNGLVVVSNATVNARGHDYIGYNTGAMTVRFEGSHPKWRHMAASYHFRASNASSVPHLDFFVPVGGYQSAPYEAIPSMTVKMGNNGSGTSSAYPVAVNVLPDSPAARVDEEIATPLVIWPGVGINTEKIVKGTLPTEASGSAFVWGEGTAPTSLAVTIVGSAHKNRLTVAGEPEAVLGDKVSPSYGHVDDGTSRTLTATPGLLTIDEGARRATCTGWKLYDIDPATQEPAGEAVESGEDVSYAWEPENKWQRFAWQWNIESKVNVSAEAGGTAATSADWVTEGETATLTATPADESWRFWKWTGDVPEGHDRDNPLVLTVDQAKNVVAVFGHVRYVSTTGDDDNNDGTTTNTAFATVKKALAGIADGDEVRILEGTFDAASNVVSGADNASAYVIANDIRIVGAGRDKTILTANHLPKDTRLFQFNNAEAVLSSLTISNVVYLDSYYDNGHGVQLKAGKVFDCTFRNFTQTGYYATGAGIHVDGADTLVSNCVFNTMTVGAVYVTGAGRLYDIEIVSGGSGNYGVGQVYVNATGALVDGLYVHDGTTRGLTVGAGTVQNALVCRQTVSGSDNAGVTVNGKDAVLRYATVADCLSTTATDGKDGIQQTLGLVEYSISARNGSFGSALVTGGTFRNNLTDRRVAGADASCLVGDPQFTDAAIGDYTLQLGSLAQDAADDASVALDLVRTPRPQGAMSDFGCYERTSSGGALQVGFKVIGFADVLTGGAFSFLAVVDGDTDGIAYAWYVDGSDTASGTDATFALEGAANGKHTVKLVVTNGKGGRAELEKPDVVEVHPKTVYVSHAGSAEYPYDDPAKAASSLADAIAALWSGTPELCTIDVAEGLYTNTALVNLNFPVQILGAGSGTTWVTTTNTIVQVFGLADEQARLEGLTVTNVTLTDSGNLVVMSKGTCADVEIAKCKNAGNPYSTTGGAFYMSGGVVTNCAVRGLDYKGGYGKGAAIYAADGLVVDTVVENGSLSGYVLHVTGTATFRRCTVSGYPGSAALIVTDTASPLFDSCRFFRNTSGSTMCTLASSAKMVNCEVFGNVNTGTGIAGLSVAGSAVVDHCTVTGNRTQNDTSVHGGLDQTGGTVVHSIFYDNAADHGNAVRTTGGTYADNVDAADPKFADVASDDYRLTLGSPAIDVIASGDTVGTDMEGLERPLGAGWDCGAHEFDPSTVPFGCGITVSQKVFVKGSDVPVSGVAAGSTEVLAFAWYVDGGAEPVASGADVVLKGLGTGFHSLRLVVTEQGGARRVTEATVENAFELRPIEVWVSKTGASKHPYDTPAAAATNLQDALDALWAGAGVTGFVHVAEGVYTNTAQVALAAPIRLEGAGIDRTVFTGKVTSGTSAFHILDDGASIDGITIKGFTSLEYGGSDGAGLSVKAGVGRNIRVTECVRTKAYSSPGGAVYVSGTGVLLDSVVDGNEASSHWGNGRGAGLYQDGGRVERCRIVDNEETSGEQGGGVYLKGGVFANALILSNKTTSAAGVWQEGGTMINCTVADNVATKDDGFQVVSSSGKSYNNLFAGDAEHAASIADAVTTNGNVVAASEAVFTSRRSQPYRLKLGSPAVNAGDNAAVEECALTTDMDGHDRIWLKGKRKDATADAGCYEFSYTGTVIIVR